MNLTKSALIIMLDLLNPSVLGESNVWVPQVELVLLALNPKLQFNVATGDMGGFQDSLQVLLA